MTSRFFALVFLLFPVLLHAQATRTWVSGVGDDANAGSRTDPCKTFAGAISKTSAGGIITILDPAGAGGVTITKSITIDGNGLEGAVLVSGTNGIIVNAGTSDVVTLRNLTIEGLGTGLSAINILQAGVVHIENCQINGFTTTGINLVTTTAGTHLFIKDTTIHKCPAVGVSLAPTAAATIHVENSHIVQCGNGVSAAPNATLVANDTFCEGNTGEGFVTTAAGASMSLIRCTSSGNQVGVQSGGSISLSDCVVANNIADGLKHESGGKIVSFRTNKVSGNTPNGAATSFAKLK